MSAMAPVYEQEAIVAGATLSDHFRIVRRLGAGGMGEVYLAENLELPDKRHAIKVLRSDLSAAAGFAQRLKVEASVQARLGHDNIVEIHDVFHWKEHFCLVLAYVEGTTLAELIKGAPEGLP